MKLSSIAAAVLLSSVVASSAQASQVAAELHGYVRSGTLWTTNGMRNANRLGLRAGSEGYFRLGNEEDTKLELLPTIKWTADDGVWAKMRANITHQTGDTSDWNSDGFDKDIEVRETFIEMGGLEFNPSTVFWAGKRYSQMEISSHQYSYDYLQNNGTGGGFENMDIGFAKWDLGVYDYTVYEQGWSNWSEVNGKQGSPNELSVNTWLHAIGGTGLDIQFKYIDTDKIKFDEKKPDGVTVWDGKDYKTYAESNQATEGYLVSVLYNTPGFFWFGNGYGKICFQYAKGADAGTKTGQNGYGWGNNADQETTRLIVEGLWDITKSFSTSVFAMYQYDHALNEWSYNKPEGPYNKNASFYAIGVRPFHQITNHFAMQYELGYEHQNHEGTGWGNGLKSASLFKATIAPSLTLDMGYWGRPQIRAFVTYAKWSKGASECSEFDKNNTRDAYNKGKPMSIGDRTDTVMVGFQGEAWF